MYTVRLSPRTFSSHSRKSVRAEISLFVLKTLFVLLSFKTRNLPAFTVRRAWRRFDLMSMSLCGIMYMLKFSSGVYPEIWQISSINRRPVVSKSQPTSFRFPKGRDWRFFFGPAPLCCFAPDTIFQIFDSRVGTGKLPKIFN
uniref:Uncharacterized protein n=1 Tax=Cacopsylla melanoneura TaxID=428564 RepID=A0A8D8UM42_9HEMI